MSKMNVYDTPKYRAFTKDEQDIVKAGVDLYKHYLFVNKGVSKFKEFAEGKSYEEKEKLFNESLIRESYNRAGVAGSGFNDTIMMQNPNVKWAMFALISETLNVIIPSTVLDNFSQFAEVRNVGWGDNLKFTIPNNDLFIVSKIGNGMRRGEPQRLYNSDLVLTPEAHEVTIQEDIYRILAGKVNWGDWITRIAQSFETKISTDVYNTFYNSYESINPAFKEATFNKDAFVELAQRVQAVNRGAKVSVFGTQIALSKIADAAFTNTGSNLRDDYIRMGYMTNYLGIDLFKLDQRIVPNDPEYKFSIADDSLYFVSTGTEAPVKIGFEGQVMINNQGQYGANADNTVDHNVQSFYDVALASSAKHGVMRVS